MIHDRRNGSIPIRRSNDNGLIGASSACLLNRLLSGARTRPDTRSPGAHRRVPGITLPHVASGTITYGVICLVNFLEQNLFND